MLRSKAISFNRFWVREDISEKYLLIKQWADECQLVVQPDYETQMSAIVSSSGVLPIYALSPSASWYVDPNKTAYISEGN